MVEHMDLEALADFNAVATHDGFGRASRATGRPKPSLSRRVRELEDQLGVRLLERGARVLRLTEEGRALHEQTRGLLERIDDVGETLKTGVGKPHGRLRVSAPVLFAHRGLGRIAADFAAAYPDVQLEIVADDRFIDPSSDAFDLVIRANPQASTELAGRCFLRDALVVAARADRPRPRDGSSVAAVVLPGVPATASWRLSGKPEITVDARAVLTLSSMAMIYDAVMAGAGAAMMPRSLVQGDIAAGRLVEWGHVVGRTIEVWALYPPHRHVSSKVSAFIRALTERFADGSPAGFDTLPTH
jgi:DNA-binding transcriptional LysR family regulator